MVTYKYSEYMSSHSFKFLFIHIHQIVASVFLLRFIQHTFSISQTFLWLNITNIFFEKWIGSYTKSIIYFSIDRLLRNLYAM